MIEDFNIMENYLILSLKLSINIKSSIFIHPEESRFKNLFQNQKNKKRKKTMSVNPKNILLGMDKRTSIIIKNIPENITGEKFRQMVMNFSPLIDFYYIPNKIRTRKKLRVAFVNVLNYSQIVPIFMGLLYKTKFKYYKPNTEMEICYSKVQGKNLLIKRFSHELMLNT